MTSWVSLTALRSLALETINPDLTSKSNPVPLDPPRSVNRCVTLWVYIDERSGKVLDAGVERTVISCPLALSFDSATSLLSNSLASTDPALKKARAMLEIIERNVGRWKEYNLAQNEASSAREKRLQAREVVSRAVHGADNRRRRRDNGSEGFSRTRGHQTVDACLELYGHGIRTFLEKRKTAFPRIAGTGPDRLARVATAPLRRFVDGIAQRQVLSVMCGYGGEPLTKQQCVDMGIEATNTINKLNNSDYRKRGSPRREGKSQREAIAALRRHLAGGRTVVPALGTGRKNEVVILGTGTVASCGGVRGTLRPGEEVLVEVRSIDEERGTVSATLAS